MLVDSNYEIILSMLIQAVKDGNSESEGPIPRAEHHEIVVPNIGTLNAYIQVSHYYIYV